jgi:crossover junction endodeoxyribonuclease RuvC
MLVVGLDPGLRRTGWGVIQVAGSRLSHVAHGYVESDARLSLAERLRQLHEGLLAMLGEQRPAEASVEETFVNKNPTSTLKLGQARGVALCAAAVAGVPVAEYPPNLIKKCIVGTGHAQKQQIELMVRRLLPTARDLGPDAADALAAAICHAHFRQTQARLETAR